MTGRLPRYRSLAAPARFAARWRRQAACHGTDLDLFYPERGESAGPARQVCAQCPVRQPCLEYALSNRIVHGIWGGVTERERRPLQSDWIQAERLERDRAILAADAAGYTAAVIGRSFGLSPISVARIVRAGNEDARPEPNRFAVQALSMTKGESECAQQSASTGGSGPAGRRGAG